MQEKLVAIAPFIRSCPQVITLGVRASMGDYSSIERRMLLSASQVLFPTPRFVRILQAAGKKTFPSAFAYSVQRYRLVQEVLFQFLKCPHPFTRIYYGRQKNSIEQDFSFPFRAMGPKAQDSPRTVGNVSDLRAVSEIYNPLIIQETLDYQERFRLVFVNYECVGIIKRISSRHERGFDGDGIPAGPRLDQWVAPECFSRRITTCLERLLGSVQINDVAAEIGMTGGEWRLIELGRPPLSWPAPGGAAYRYGLISRLIESGKF